MHVELYTMSVIAEFVDQSEADKVHNKLALNDLFDTTVSLKWPGVTMHQVQRMKGLISEWQSQGLLKAPAALSITKYDPSTLNQTQTQPVSLARKAVNVTKAAVRALRQVAKRRPVLVDERTQEGRFAICEACPHFHNGSCADVILEDGTVERGCGCNLRFKTSVKTEACPHGKW